MRLWMVPPSKMCRKHLLGEHVECHMFVGCILKKKSLSGYISGGLVEIHNIGKRHDLLARELIRRGYRHKTPLKRFVSWKEGRINRKEARAALARRCSDCRKRGV